MADRRYEHDARRGETRYPPESGSQYGGRPGERDPHERLNTPVSEVEEDAETLPGNSSGADVQGMGRRQKHGNEAPGDPELHEGSRGDRETRNPGQTTPRGMLDAELAAVRDAEAVTGVPLEPPAGARRRRGQRRRERDPENLSDEEIAANIDRLVAEEQRLIGQQADPASGRLKDVLAELGVLWEVRRRRETERFAADTRGNRSA